MQAIVTEVHNIDDAISRLHPSLTSLTGALSLFPQNHLLTKEMVGNNLLQFWHFIIRFYISLDKK